MSPFGKTKLIAVLFAALLSANSFADDIHLQNLLGCFQQLRPFTLMGNHASVYPSDQNFVFIPGKFGDKDGVYVYSDQGASFVAISEAFAKKAIAFDVSSSKGAQSVVYQPSVDNKRAQVWMRGPSNGHTAGVTVLFKAADDQEKRAALVSELDSMARGMAKTWDSREDQLVEAVEQGKYLWVEVDLDHYKAAANQCSKILTESSETAPIRNDLHSEIDLLNDRAARNGVVKDQQIGAPSGFMTTPQY